VLHASNPVKEYLDCLEFTDDYWYKYWIGLSVVVNSVLTFACEKLIVAKLTVICDKKGGEDKARNFKQQMIIAKDQS